MGIEETLLQKVNQQNKDIKDLSVKLEKLNTLIVGNGKVGLAEEVRNNRRFRANATKLMWVMVGQTVAFVALLVTVIIAFIK